jgi:hypothetical protein
VLARNRLYGLLVLTLAAFFAGAARTDADEAFPFPGRVEVVLANQYRQDTAAIKKHFAESGFINVHIQFVRQGQPPPNIGLGREVPAEFARAAIRLAVKYNKAVKILLPAYLFPPRFVTIASSNFDDTVEFAIDEESLRNLQDPSLSTEQFHALYRRLTTPVKDGTKGGSPRR